MGLKGKKHLNPRHMKLVWELTFTVQPVQSGESEKEMWCGDNSASKQVV